MSSETTDSRTCQCCILGAGPSGLGAARELTKNGVTDIIIIDRNKAAGGLSRTEVFDGVRFDAGPHRFFTKNEEINALWHETLGDDFRPVSRLTRIYYENKFFSYPIKPIDTLIKLGPIRAVQMMTSFAFSKFGKKKEDVSFEDWITQRFGRKLYETFFKTYTEKVWGIPCNEIGAEWAAQRIKGLDVIQVLKNAFLGGTGKVKTLVEEFDYPVLGAGQMYERMCADSVEAGAHTLFEAEIVSVNRNGSRIESIEVETDGGARTTITAAVFLTSLPMTCFFKMMSPGESEDVVKAVDALYFRDHITVDVVIDKDDVFPDQWIYVHSPEVKMGRIANYNNFSKAMVGKEGKTALSVEYFVFRDDEIWNLSDGDLKDLACAELEQLGLTERSSVEQGWIVRETESYPTYYIGFTEHYDLLKRRLDEYENLIPMGRGGLYKYDNQDHSLYSGLLAARNYLKAPGSPYSLWDINIDAEYHESDARK